MVALDPNNMKWRMEVQNSIANLGSVRQAQRRFTEAAALSEQALRTIQALTTFDPKNRDYQQSLVEALAWSADAERDAGHLDQAVALRERHVSLLTSLLSQTGASPIDSGSLRPNANLVSSTPFAARSALLPNTCEPPLCRATN